MALPKYLSHTPIFGVDEYYKYDGVYAAKGARSDAEAITVGLAQFDKDAAIEERDISAKVFRRANGRWSAQSEELPLHRAFDLSSLILKSILLSGDVVPPATATINPERVRFGDECDEARKARVREFYTSSRKAILPKVKELQQVLEYFIAHEEQLLNKGE